MKTKAKTSYARFKKGRKYVCPECGAGYKMPQHLGAHRKHAHGVTGTSDSAVAAQKKKTEKNGKPPEDEYHDQEAAIDLQKWIDKQSQPDLSKEQLVDKIREIVEDAIEETRPKFCPDCGEHIEPLNIVKSSYADRIIDEQLDRLLTDE
jgi:ribosomal protein S27AE